MKTHTQSKQSKKERKGNAQMSAAKVLTNTFPTIMPNRFRTKLRYGDLVDLASASTSTSHVIRCSAYDPDFTGVGEQPVGFDQLMAFYTNFVVTKARLKVDFGFQASPTISHLCAVWLTRASGTPSTVAGVLGQPYLKKGVMNVGGPSLALDSGWLSMAAFFGMTESEYRAVEDFWGTASADPTVPARFVIYAANIVDGAVGVSQTYGLADLEIEVEFFNRVQLNAS